MSKTLFDKILSGEIPSDKVYEDETVLAFRDINPQAPIHILVIPKKKIARIADVGQWSDMDTGRFFKKIAIIADKLELNKAGYRVVINNGDNGGQEVEYIHAHILGGRRLSWPPG